MLAFAAAALIAPAAFAQTAVTAGWIQPLPADSPSIRTGASMSYDSGNQESVLFGGVTTGGTLLSDTWLWDGTTWTVQAPANSPAARQDAAVAYDAGHSLTILFGGIDGNGTVLNDTWEWDGTNWTQLSTTGGPTDRHGASITYDGTSGKILLFGGIDGNGTYLSDTWTWNGTTWTKLAPSASPSARAFAGLTYNPGQSNDLLFAGEGSGGALNDTWFWNGTTWTAQTPSQSPTARFGATLVYNAAASVPELFGGWDGTNTFGDTWTWNGSTWVRQGALAAISGRYGSAATFNGATNAVQVFGGVDAAGLEGDTWNLYGTVPNFGNVAVGSSVTQPVTFVFTASDTLNPVSPYVVTSHGYAGLDFNDAGGSSCFPAAPFVALDTCTVNVTFSPKAPGVRVGSVNLVDAQGATLAIAQLGGVGMGPQVEFPMPPTAEQNASVYYGTSGFDFSLHYRVYELTIDEGGYGFIVDPGYDQVVKESPSGVEESLGVGAFGVALDGAGSVLTTTGNSLLRTPPDQKIGTFSTASATLLSGLSGAGNLAVDASGNIFFTDVNNPYVTELLAINGVVTPSSPQIAVGSGLSSPRGLTVDGNGNVFVADRGNNRIVEIVAVNGAVSANSTVQALGSGFSQPWDVSLDAAGDLLISDYGNSALKELIAGNGVVAPNSIPVTLLDNTTNPILQPYFPLAVNIDASSNVRLALTAEALTGVTNGSFDSAPGGVILLPYSTAPELAFSGTTDPQSLTVFNSGNEPLSFSDVSVDTSNFSLSGSTCTSATTLAPSTACTLVMAPNPAVTGIVTGTVHLSDNGQPGSTQTVALIYYGPAPPAAMLFTPASPVLKGFVALLTASCNVDSLDPIAFSILSGPATLVTSNGTYIRYTGFGQVVIQATQAAGSGSPTCPTMTATVQVVAQQTIGFPMPSQTIFPGFATLAATATSGLPVSYTVLSGPATIAGSTLTYTGAGSVVVQATQAGNANNVAAVPVTVTIQVSLAEAFIDWAPAALKIYTGTPLGAGVLDATDSIPATIGYTAALVPAGSPAAVDPTTVLPQGSYTLTALFTPFDLTHYGPVSDSLGFDVQNMNVFTANGAAGVGSFYNIGTVQSSAVSAGGIGMAVDNAGYVWSANEDGSGVSRFTNDGIRAGNYTGAAGVSHPSAVAIDGAGTVWVANGGNGTVSAYSNAGTALTPPGGSSTGSAGASGISIDQSGNVWVSSAGGNSVTELLGAATPAVPIATGVANLTLGSRP